MNLKNQYIATFLTATFAITGCKLQPQQTNTEVKHVWGNTQRHVPGFNYVECDKNKDTEYPSTARFLNEMLNHITKNNPATFKKGSDLDPSSFALTHNSSVANAGTTMIDRSIVVYTPLITETANLHEVGFILSHELAHIT